MKKRAIPCGVARLRCCSNAERSAFFAAALLPLSFWLVAMGAGVDLASLPPAAGRPVDFAKDIQPLLEEKCYGCHGPDRHENELRWDVKTIALKSGISGPAIVPGHSAESRMIRLVAGLEKGLVMPEKGSPLTPEQIGLLRAWIDQGAPWPDELAHPRPPDKADWWAFKPAARPPVPQIENRESPISNAIDCFILAAKLLLSAPVALGIDHEKLTFRHNSIDRRLTDVHGEVIQDILA